nr:MAG TPA: hypothetical protein [Caudoviricetes sp.]
MKFYRCFKTYLPPKSVKNAQNEKNPSIVEKLGGDRYG